MNTSLANTSLPAHFTERALARSTVWALAISCCCLGISATAAGSDRVTLLRTPDGGIQPQAAADSRGTIHLIYYKGDNMKGDVFYVRQQPRQEGFSKPLQVNSKPGSAMAGGTIRGAQLAVGREGRAHVAWNGHAPRKGAWMEAPMFYTRLNDPGTAFEPERDVITSARGLDGGGSVAADSQGNVFVLWHAPKPGNTNGEAGRAVFVARSQDDGKTFAPEKLATSKPTGACGCCGMKAFADNQGNVFALYRAATEKLNRDEILLISRNHGTDFQIAHTHPWKIATCPMSSASLSSGPQGLLSAWETAGQIYFALANPVTMQVSEPIAPSGFAKRKHPVVVGNGQGETLLVWTEGTGFAKGGSVAWQVFDNENKPTAEKGRAEGVPASSLATAFAKQDGTFVIVY